MRQRSCGEGGTGIFVSRNGGLCWRAGRDREKELDWGVIIQAKGVKESKCQG